MDKWVNRRAYRGAFIPATVLKMDLTPAALRLYGVYALHVNNAGVCWPSNKVVLECMPDGTSKRGLLNAKAELERHGLLVRQPHFAKSGRQVSNVYWLMVPELPAEAPPPPDDDDDFALVGDDAVESRGDEAMEPRDCSPDTSVSVGPGTPTRTRSRSTELTQKELIHKNQVGGDALRVAHRWEELFIQHRGDKPYVSWAKEIHRLKPVVTQLGLPKTLELLERFFTFNGGFVKDSDYGVGAFIGSLRRLQADPVKVMERDRPWLGPNLGT